MYKKNRPVKKSMLIAALLLPIAFAAPRFAQAAGPFDGNWTFRYPCDGLTRPQDAQQCQQGEGDAFMLDDLPQQGKRICGSHLVTAYMHNKVDEGDFATITGSVTGNVATVQFRSAWGGTPGTATLTRRDDALVWHVVKPAILTGDAENPSTGSDSIFPDDAVLTRDRSALVYHPMHCDTPAN